MKKTVVFAFFSISLICPGMYLFAETLASISNRPFPIPRMPEVSFKHDSHNERASLESCQACHHVYKNGIKTKESSEGTACAECHIPSLHSKGLNLAAAYHNQCKGCHLAEKKGPVVCGECHRAKKFYNLAQ